MSIIIKGIKMPKGCAVCPYCDRYWSKPKCHAKSFKGRYMSQKLFLDSRRQDWCPLVEVPTPHGRLVDINTILRDGNRGCVDELITDPELSEQIKVGVSATRVIICSAPTIIEAEE